MELNALRRLVRRGEGLQLEFKRKARHPEKLAREVVAFANTEGGTLLIGVDDDQTIYGCKFADEDEYAVSRYLDEHIHPKLDYELEYINVGNGRSVLAYHIESAPSKPYYLIDEEGPTRKMSFVRVADMSIRASREMIQVLHHSARKNGVRIQFGDKEKAILQLLEKEAFITLAKAQNWLKISKRKTSNLLITLVRAGLLLIHPSEKGDTYSLAEESFR